MPQLTDLISVNVTFANPTTGRIITVPFSATVPTEDVPVTPVLTPPSIAGVFNPPDGTIGVPYSYSFAGVFGGVVDTYTLVGIKPSWMTFDGVAKTLTGTPDTIALTSNLKLNALNTAGNTDSNIADINIVAAPVIAPVLSGTFDLIDTTAGTSFNFDASVLATGGDAPTAWSLTGIPPTNAVISSVGLITGVSVEEILAADSYGVQAINSGGGSNILTDADGITISAAIPDAPINLTLVEGTI